MQRLLKLGFGLMGLTSTSVGVWMFSDPSNWYRIFPGGIADFGPSNLHFIRDLGGWFIAGGILLLFALSNPQRFGGVAIVVNLVGLGSHAATHVMDIVSGRVGAKHWIFDFPSIFLPVLLLGIMLWVWWRLQSSLHPIPDYPNGPDGADVEDETVMAGIELEPK